jgi:hypothetical protein
MKKASYTVEDILTELDACAAELSFPMLDNGYIYLGDVRMNVYANESRWAILFEVLGYHYRYWLPRGIETDLFLCGNGIERNAYHVGQVGELGYDVSEEEQEANWMRIPPSVTKVVIRGGDVPIPRDPAVYAAKGIELDDPNQLQGEELMRVLLPEHREGMLATEEERLRVVPPRLPLFARSNEWHHPDTAGDERPSECSTFHSLAAAMVTLDPNMFLTEKPNTHWSNWPRGGAI